MINWKDLIPRPRSRFLRVRCPDCGNEQTIFDSAAIVVKCIVCDDVLAEPAGGKAKILAEVIRRLE